MRQIILILSLLPIIAVFLCKKWFVDRDAQTAKTTKLKHSANEILQQMLNSLELDHIEIKSTKHIWIGNAQVGDDWVNLPQDISVMSNAYAHGQATLHLGLLLLLQRDPVTTKRRDWAVRFGYVFPIFVTIILVFACAVAKLQILWAISALMLSLSIASCAQILTLMANLQAVDLATVVIEKKRIYPRLSEEEAVIRSAKASAWAGLIPGVLSRFI